MMIEHLTPLRIEDLRVVVTEYAPTKRIAVEPHGEGAFLCFAADDVQGAFSLWFPFQLP